MRKIVILMLLCGLFANSHAQTTNYGASSGTLGYGSSYFGYYTGNASTASSTYNSFFGTECGMFNTTGVFNSGFGWRSLYSNTSGYENVAMGYWALFSNVNGVYNTAVGSAAMYSNTSGSFNVAVGKAALGYNSTGQYNVAVGMNSLSGNSSGNSNVANGFEALASSTTGYENVAVGYRSLYSNQTGYYNVSIGSQAMYSNTTGILNTASGFQSLYSNTTGDENSSYGHQALHDNISGDFNTSFGYKSLFANTTGYDNTAGGHRALTFNSTGWDNTAFGYASMTGNTTGNYNTAFGVSTLVANSTGTYNSAFGFSAGPGLGSSNLTNTTAVGNNARPTASNQVRIGNSSVSSIGGYAGWSNLSDQRFKKDIREDVSGLEFINQLRPISYLLDIETLNAFLGVKTEETSQVKRKINRQTGFVAQEVEKLITQNSFVFDGVDAPQNEGDHYSIRYSEFVVPLVKAVQELSVKIDEQRGEIEELKRLLEGGNQKLPNEKINSKPSESILLQNFPNPFSSETEIEMILPESVSRSYLMLYNLSGTELKSIELKDRGNVKVKIAANELLPGIYIYALLSDGILIDTKRMVLTK